jgi:drug/metabolite transporter (DMT)-like permease
LRFSIIASLMSLMNYNLLILFAIPTLIWGSTWYVILYQFGGVSPEISIFYRFSLAALIAMGWAVWKKAPLNYDFSFHRIFILQGLFNFCLNYIFTYHSEKYIASGLVAATFSLLPMFNTIGLRFFFKEKTNLKTFISLFLGVVGLLFIFKDQFQDSSEKTLLGIGLGLIATVFASLGNMANVKNTRQNIPIISSVSWGMVYGALFSLIIGLAQGQKLIIDPRPSYWGSLLYLSLFGTVICFFLYFELVKKIGAAKAGYTSIMIPVVALTISSVLENYSWTWTSITGMALCLSGQLMLLRR